jgi:Tol biopolymer transport system component
VSVVGGSFRKVHDNADSARPSPDGSRIAFLSGGDIWLMGAAGEAARPIAGPEDGYSFFQLRWAPNGRRLAYLKRGRGGAEASIESIAADGGSPAVVISDRRIRNFCWTSDAGVVFDRTELPPNETSSNLWRIGTDTATGRPLGQATRLTSWTGFFSFFDLDATADGKRLVFIRRRDQSDVYVGRLVANGKRLEHIRRLTHDERSDWATAWTRDSKAVLFYSDRNGHPDLFRLGLEAETAEAIALGSEEERTPRWSSDGSWLLYLAWPRSPVGIAPSSGRLMRMPAAGGSPQSVLDVKGYPGSVQVQRLEPFPLSSRGHPDFRCPSAAGVHCIVSEADDKQVVLSSFDPRRGRIREVARVDVDGPPGDTFWDLSPDGSRIAFGEHRKGRIRILPLNGGAAREVSLGNWRGPYTVAWSADSRSLFLTTWIPGGSELLRVALDGEIHHLHRHYLALEFPLPSPDGTHLAFSRISGDSNVWLIDNFR